MSWADRTDKLINGYVPTYIDLLNEIGTAGRILELGVAGGGSLAMWQAFCPEGRVVGVDVDKGATWPSGTDRLIAEQDDVNLLMMLRAAGYEWFDLIVDDASHQGVATAVSLRNLWPLVRPGRWYVIEDWGVGFRGRAPMYDPEMLFFARHLPELFAPDQTELKDVEELRFRDGLIIIKKKPYA